jgi:hypothetical protein
MSIITGQQISKYFENYANIEVTFTKEVIQATQLVSKQVFLKCVGYQWPCIIYSCSLVGAKIIVNVKSSIQEITGKANNVVSLRFSFRKDDKNDPLAFFVSAKITGYSAYSPQNPDLNFIALSFTQRPADDLIEILGSILEANINSKKRKEDRIDLSPENLQKLGIKAREMTVLVQGVPRKGILRDLSFSGAKIIIMGVAKFLLEKDAVLRLDLEAQEPIDIPGKIVRHEPVEGRKDISAFVIVFTENKVPMTYKFLINDFLKTSAKRKDRDP